MEKQGFGNINFLEKVWKGFHFWILKGVCQAYSEKDKIIKKIFEEFEKETDGTINFEHIEKMGCVK